MFINIIKMHIKGEMRYNIDGAVGKKVNFRVDAIENLFFSNQLPITNLYKRQQINWG